MNKVRSRHASLRSGRDHLKATARDVHEKSVPHSEQFKIADTMRWDRLTIRQWFNIIDEAQNGVISKQEWMTCLRENPKFRAMLLNMNESVCPDRFSKRSSQKLQLEAKEMKKVMLLWNELDADKNGTLDFDRFITLFERTGHYFQFRDEANPRQQMASMLNGTQASELSGGSECPLMDLAKQHIPRERRPSIEFNIMQQMAAESPKALHKESQLPFDLTWADPVDLNRSANIMEINSRVPSRQSPALRRLRTAPLPS
jgi:Ca2+-binding EF-hand superfamily protein